jgi:hypothetical protein
MQQRRRQPTSRPVGGAIEVSAKTAVHDFLKYRIRERATGDSVSIQK